MSIGAGGSIGPQEAVEMSVELFFSIMIIAIGIGALVFAVEAVFHDKPWEDD